MSARLSRPVSVRRLAAGETVAFSADPQERAALAEALDLIAIDSLSAELTGRSWRGEGVRIEGRVRGAVQQACIVTLEPVAGTVDEAIDVRLHPDARETTTVDVDPDAPDPPERLEGELVDLGAIALEHFALGLDPYPRSPDAAFEEAGDGPDEDEEPSPFAVLAALKNKDE